MAMLRRAGGDSVLIFGNPGTHPADLQGVVYKLLVPAPMRQRSVVAGQIYNNIHQIFHYPVHQIISEVYFVNVRVLF